MPFANGRRNHSAISYRRAERPSRNGRLSAYGNRVYRNLPKESNIAKKNISIISAMEQEALANRTPGERLGDTIARVAGTTWFIGLHFVWFVAWLSINARVIPGVAAFDPYPFQFLTFVTSLEAIFLSLFILMSQNRAGRQAEAREHLNLQIDLLSEQESTKMLGMLQSLCKAHGLPEARDEEIHDLKNQTEPEKLLHELKESLPGK